MKKILVRVPALALATGATAGTLIMFGSSAAEYALAALCVALSVFLGIKGARHSALYAILGFSWVLISGTLNRASELPQELCDGDSHRYTLRVERVSQGRVGQRALCTALTAKDRACSRFLCYLGLADLAETIAPGDIISVDGSIESIGRYADLPFMEQESRNARSDGVSATVFSPHSKIVHLASDNSLKYRLLRMRDNIASAIYATPLPADVSALIVASCLGTGDAPPELKESFRASGLSHLLCVSGFHVGLVAALVFALLWPMKLWSHAGRLRYLVVIIAVWLYTGLVGLTPSAVRAAIMLSAYLAAKLMQRGSSGFNSLALAVAVMLIVKPLWLFAAGFQLSVCAVLGLLVFARKFNPVAMRRQHLYRLCELFTVPLAAMLGTAPVVLSRFHRLPLLGILTNAVATVVFAPFMILGALCAWLLHTGHEAAWLQTIVCGLHKALNAICDISATFGDGAVEAFYPEPLTILCLIGATASAALALYVAKSRFRTGCIAAMLAFGLLGSCSGRRTFSDNIIIHGNRLGTEICAVSKGRGYIIPVSGRSRPLGNFNAYFEGHGIEPDSVVFDPAPEIYSPANIAIATKGSEVFRRASHLLVDGRFDGDIDEVIEAVGPQYVILGANTSREIADRIASREGVTVLKLTEKAMHIKL